MKELLQSSHGQGSHKILVTGAASRIGRSIAETLHAAGADIAVHYGNSESEAREVVRSMNRLRSGSAVCVHGDLREDDCTQIVDQVLNEFGRLDVLVNNASVFLNDADSLMDRVGMGAKVEENYLVNFLAPYRLSNRAAPYLADSSGCIVNIADINGEHPLSGYALYSASKAALINLTRSLACDLGPRVRVNAVSPGAICWPVDSAAFDERQRIEILSHSLLRREGTPNDVAKAVRYLVFDAPYVTGSVINVDGGRMARM